MTAGTDIVPMALLSDTARMFRQLGMESIRASVVNLDSMALQPAWSISDLGETDDDPTQRPLDSAFPGGASMLAQIGRSMSGETLAQKLSPRLWILAWRLDNLHAVVAEARYREPQSSMGEVDLALMRLVCNTGIRAKLSNLSTLAEEADVLVWPLVDRRQRSKSVSRRLAALMICVVGALAGLWLAFVALPAAQDALTAGHTELARSQALADATMARSLSAAMATGDYGEVQAALASFEALGYVQRAVVTNPLQLNVAMVGPTEGQSIGRPVSPDMVRSARALDLRMGAQRYGQLLVMQPGLVPTPSPRLDGARLAAALVVALAIAGLALLIWRPRQAAAS